MTTDALKAERDAAFAEYLAVRKAGGRAPAKLATLIKITRRWYRSGGTIIVWQADLADEAG